MKVHTETEAFNTSRRTVVELLIAEHPAECLPAAPTSIANCKKWQLTWE